MKFVIVILITAVISYLLGSINFSIIVVKLMTGRDIRDMGSKNAGLTNTLRCAGKTCALLTLIGDILKGVAAVWIARGLCHLVHAGGDTHYIGYIAGFFVVLGHVFPLYYEFKGGKGVLAGFSAFLAIDYKAALALLIIFITVLCITRYVSLSSIISAAYSPLAALLFAWIVRGSSFGLSFLYFVLTLPITAMIIWRHMPNIERLRDESEPKFSFNRTVD